MEIFVSKACHPDQVCWPAAVRRSSWIWLYCTLYIFVLCRLSGRQLPLAPLEWHIVVIRSSHIDVIFYLMSCCRHRSGLVLHIPVLLPAWWVSVQCKHASPPILPRTWSGQVKCVHFISHFQVRPALRFQCFTVFYQASENWCAEWGQTRRVERGVRSSAALGVKGL